VRHDPGKLAALIRRVVDEAPHAPAQTLGSDPAAG
jgi:hypothetical protein